MCFIPTLFNSCPNLRWTHTSIIDSAIFSALEFTPAWKKLHSKHSIYLSALIQFWGFGFNEGFCSSSCVSQLYFLRSQVINCISVFLYFLTVFLYFSTIFPYFSTVFLYFSNVFLWFNEGRCSSSRTSVDCFSLWEEIALVSFIFSLMMMKFNHHV